MTIKEAANIYGITYYETTLGDDLIAITRKLYSKDSTKGREILTELNPRVDWDFLPAGEKIAYIRNSYVTVEQSW